MLMAILYFMVGIIFSTPITNPTASILIARDAFVASALHAKLHRSTANGFKRQKLENGKLKIKQQLRLAHPN